MKTKVLVCIIGGLLIIIAVLLVSGLLRTTPGTGNMQPTVTQSDYYTCPMHPSVRSDRPGACPVCGMALVKKSSLADTAAANVGELGEVTVSPSQQVLANVGTSVAEVRSLVKEIRTVGMIVAAETNTRKISARFPGRIDHLYITYTGQSVQRGDPVADVYSPEAISGQQEFLLALAGVEREPESPSAKDLLVQSREKLLRWGFTGRQVEDLERMRIVRELVTIHSPISGTVTRKNVEPQHYAAAGEDLFEVADLSTVWMNAQVYEYEIRSLKVGETVVASADAYPGLLFTGRVTFISPTVDPASRTVNVRAEFRNPDGSLRTDMYVNAMIKVRLPAAVIVPTSALLSTGERQVVWVEKSDGVFEPRRVVVGQRAGEDVQILEGIKAGDVIVTSGGYLLDSESQLEAPARTSDEGTMPGMNSRQQ
jgi:membrane fusion protein, copper/silver efflux system